LKKTTAQIINQYYNNIKRTLYFPLGLYRYYKEQKLTENQNAFIQILATFKSTVPKEKEDGILLIQMVENYEYTLKFAAAAKVISEKHNLSTSFYDLRWTKWIGWKRNYESVFKFFNNTTGLEQIHFSFGEKIIFRNEEKFYDQDRIKNELTKISQALKNPEDLLYIKFESVLVGDLIYDSYLRYFHKPTIEQLNKNVIKIIEIGLNIYYNFNYFLKNNKVKCLLNTYSSYLGHGIPARVCLEKGVCVYTIGSGSYILQKLTKDFPYHFINHTSFSPDKILSRDQIDLAKETLTSRFDGKIDAATNYMKQSAYFKGNVNPGLIEKFRLKKRNLVIYVHDFYDSPHLDRLLQFADLYQYLKQTLEAVKDIKDTSVFIKTHPNGIEGCKEKTIELVTSFNKDHFYILDETVSNLNVIELKPTLIATARGTVGIEMAYFGIPTVALYDNFYVNFKFAHSCTDKETYFSILRGEKEPEIDFDKEKIYSLYYQAFLEKICNDNNSIFTLLNSFKGNTYSEEYLAFLTSDQNIPKLKTLLEHYCSALNKT